MSGLSTAATLAKAGKRVLVLEQSSYLGGGASTRQINGINFDIGTYFIGEVRNKRRFHNSENDFITNSTIWTNLFYKTCK